MAASNATRVASGLADVAEATTSNIIPARKKFMSTLNGVLEAATRHADTSNDLAIAAGQVVAKRVALGMAAALNPLQADHAELGRIVPEKVEAFSAAGMIMLERSNEAGWEITRLASDEVMTTARAAIAIAACATPAAMAEAQGKFALAWFNRAATNFFALGMLGFGVQQAVMAPIRKTVAANTERLGR
jgi:hypothetical protein